MPYKDPSKAKEWFQKNHQAKKNDPEYRAERKRRYKKAAVKKLAYVKSHLSDHPCVDCGEADLRCLDFDHVRGEKLFQLGDAKGYSYASIDLEIAKCEVRCANCHRKVTYDRRKAGEAELI